MENEIFKAGYRIPNVFENAHFDFKLDGWPASAALITLCLSGVIVYGIKTWGMVNSIPSASVTTLK